MTKNKGMTQAYFTISNEDIKNDVITLVLSNEKVIKIPFDFKNSLVSVKVKLRNKVFITEDEDLFCFRLLHELDLPHILILSIFVQYVLNEEAVVHKQHNLIALNYFKTDAFYLHEFIKVPGYYNIYFVVNYDRIKNSLLCVEVHPSASFTYGLSNVCLKQVLPTQWGGLENESLIGNVGKSRGQEIKGGRELNFQKKIPYKYNTLVFL